MTPASACSASGSMTAIVQGGLIQFSGL